jgi:hypothetical protein
LSSIFPLLVVLLFSIGCMVVLPIIVFYYWFGFFSDVIRYGIVVIQFCLGEGATMVLVWPFVLSIVLWYLLLCV